jgi:hypothetical protein
MSIIRRSIALVLVAGALSVSACAPASRFEWGGYEGALYAYSKKPDLRPQYRVALEKTIEQGRKSNRVAPGLQAELGYILLEDGDRAGALKQFDAEMRDFPESRAFLRGVADRITGEKQKAEVAS